MKIDRSETVTGGGPRAFVVAVCGTSGAGKSTLVERTCAVLGKAASLHFDDYVVLGNDAGTIRDWLDAGADPDALQTPQMRRDLEQLSAGAAVGRRGGCGLVRPAPIILVEEPFGRARRELAPLIDLAVHIEVPIDVAMARRLLRAIAAPETSGAAQLVKHIDVELRTFLAAGRAAYLAAAAAARGSADLLLDGMLPVDALAATLAHEIRRRTSLADLDM